MVGDAGGQAGVLAAGQLAGEVAREGVLLLELGVDEGDELRDVGVEPDEAQDFPPPDSASKPAPSTSNSNLIPTSRPSAEAWTSPLYSRTFYAFWRKPKTATDWLCGNWKTS